VRCLKILTDHMSSVKCLLINDFGDLVSGGYDNHVKVWDLARDTPSRVKTLEGHEGCVMSLALGYNGEIYSGSGDHFIKVWINNECTKTLVGHRDMVSALCASDRVDELFSGSFDKTIRIWDTRKGVCEAEFAEHMGFILCLIMGHNGNLISSSSDKSIKVWDVRGLRCLGTLKGHTGDIFTMVMTKGGELLSGSWVTHISVNFEHVTNL
jgi:F-box/WD-40 domain protein 7